MKTNRDLFDKYDWDDGMSEVRDLMRRNCIGCINSIKGICKLQGVVPEHRCFHFKRLIK